jgi:protein involved in polysaccharide export with SLBB domain
MRPIPIIGFCFSLMLASGLWGQGRIWEKTEKESFPGQKTRNWGADQDNLDTIMRWDQKTQIFLLRMPKLTSDYRMGAGDQLGIEVVGHDEFSGRYTISETGMINISGLGQIPAAELTGEELEEKIATLLKEKNLLNNPEVLMYVIDFQAKPFYVLGEVDYPGKYWMMQELTFTEAILMAGGIDLGADSFGYLHRGMPQAGVDLKQLSKEAKLGISGPGHEIIRVDLKPLKEGGVLDPDIPLRPGDFIWVPTRKMEPFYVVGEVKNPGGYEIPKPAERAMMVTQAIARAGGVTATAKIKEGMLIRHGADGNREERKVDFAAILNGKQPDFEIRPKDIVFIPGSKAKTLAYGLLGIVPQTIQSAATENIQNGQ